MKLFNTILKTWLIWFSKRLIRRRQKNCFLDFVFTSFIVDCPNSHFFDNNIVINTEKLEFLKIEFKIDSLKEIIDDKVDCLFIMLRRLNGKSIALKFLAEIIENKENFQLLPPIFKNLNEILKKAEKEG